MAGTESEERLFRGYSGRMFVVLTLSIAVLKGGKFVLPPLLPAIIEDLSITPVRAGLALSTMTVLYALFHYPSGRFSDRLSRKTVVMGGLALTLSAFAVLTITPVYAAFVVGVAMLGTGDGVFSPSSRALMSDLFVRRRGQAFGVHTAFIDIGAVLASGVAIAVLAVASWRAAFVVGIVVLLPALVLFHRWNREPYEVGRIDFGVRETGRRLFANRQVRWLVVAYCLFVFTWRGAVNFLPTFLQVERGFSPALAGTAFAVLFGVGIVTKPVSGRLSDRVNRALVGAGGLFVGVAGITTLVLAPSVPVAILGVAVYGVGHKAFAPAMQAYLMDTFPDASMGGDFGAVRTVYQAVGSAGPTYVGVVASAQSYTLAFAGLAVTLLAGAAITLAVSRLD